MWLDALLSAAQLNVNPLLAIVTVLVLLRLSKLPGTVRVKSPTEGS